MKKAANVIVDRRYWILGVMLLVFAVSAFAMQKVEINEDMTKYLPDDSNMKKGMDVMTAEFPEMETLQTIRVMADDLTEEQKEELLNRLEAIPYVDSVTYEAGSEDYNVGQHTLFVLNTEYEYGSSEERSIENALDEEFSEYSLVWHNDDTGLPDLPLWIVAAAIAILMVILFAMCGSWIEPVLFLIVIGIAVVINMGTNIIMGSVSDVTFSIAAILQLVLSMDYSIILINRYRQERERIGDQKQAMKEALSHAFSSIASSSLTTVVGLLMLVFMSFKIGMDLGIVLAKGVFISMICVLTMMPGIILDCDKLIQRTAKKELHIPMDWAAGLSYRLRHGLGFLFLLLFAGVFWLQSQAGISYTLQNEDPVAEVFPAENTLVLVYECRDEEAVSQIAAEVEADEHVKSVMAYSTMLAKPYTAAELADEIADMSGGFSLDASVLPMLYYDYFGNGQTEPMTAGDFLNFISGTVMENEAFSAYLDETVRETMDLMQKLADADSLTTPMNAEELAEFFRMDAGYIENLLLYYYIEQGGVPTGNLTLADFADFVMNDVSKDEAYGSMFDQDTLKQMEQFAVFADAERMTALYDYREIASLLNMEEDAVKYLFTYYYALSDGYTPSGMTLTDFVHYIQNDLASDPVLGSAFDADTLAQVNMLALFTDMDTVRRQMTPAELAALTGMEEAQVYQLYAFYWGQDASDKTLSLEQFIDFLFSDERIAAVLDNGTYQQLGFLRNIMTAAQTGETYHDVEMGNLLGMDSSMVKMIMTYREAESAVDHWTLSMHAIINFLADNGAQLGGMMDNGDIAQIRTAQKLINGAVGGTSYSAQALAELLGMDVKQAEQLYLLYLSRHGDTSDWALSAKELIDFINRDVLGQAELAEQIDAETADMLHTAQMLAEAVVSGKSYTDTQMGELLGGLSGDFDQNAVELIYLYASSEKNSDPAWSMTMETLFDYLINDVLQDPRFADLIDDEMRRELYDAQTELTEGKEQLVSGNYARLIITSAYPEESPETTAFLDELHMRCSENLSGDFYVIGNSAMTYEMQQIFDRELLFITMLTAAAIFVIVALTFRSVFIPLILVLVVQCGVYATVSVTELWGGSIYYLALLIVECILMGATIDYGILFTNYYCESRVHMPVKEALKTAYAGAAHTIFTSGLILILVTAIVGNFFEEPTVSAIVKTISIGALCATLLILFVLPGLLAVCDRFVVRRPVPKQ